MIDDRVERIIPQVIPYRNNKYLTRISQLMKIKNTLHNMDGDFAPDPNGFGDVFSKAIGILWRHM